MNSVATVGQAFSRAVGQSARGNGNIFTGSNSIYFFSKYQQEGNDCMTERLPDCMTARLPN